MTPIDTLIAATLTRKVKLAVLGDCMQDVYVHGHLDKCQENAPKFVEDSRVEVPGGAANAARSLDRWNANVMLLGNDPYIQPVKTRYMVDGRCVFRHDDDAMDPEAKQAIKRDKAFRELRDAGRDLRGVLLSDYDKGFLTPEFIRKVIDWCNEKEIPVVCDVKRNPSVYAGSVLKCNADWWNSNKKMASIWEWPVVLTHGPGTPDIYFPDERDTIFTILPPVFSVNHVGAGDCFASHLLLALANGLTLNDAASVAYSAGRKYVQLPNNRPPWPHEVRLDMLGDAGKVIPSSWLPAIEEAIRLNAEEMAWAKLTDRKSIVAWSNGCFDLLGPHHAYLLREAKRRGDVLVVGVNSDASVRRLKGPKRPLQNQADRAQMVASLACVDWVVVFDGDDPSEELAYLRPDVRVCGDIPERNTAGDEWCGRVELVPLVEGRSTTATIEKIRERA